MATATPFCWFDDPPLVKQFPRAYRFYAQYCRVVANRSSGLVRGGSALFRLLASVHSRLGGDCACALQHGESTIFVDLSDIRVFEVLGESASDSGERRILSAFLKPGDTFVDVGANHGSFSLVASHIVGPNGLVVAFEPQRRLAKLVVQSLERTKASKFRVFAAGCSDRARAAEFYVPKTGSGSAGIFKAFSGSPQGEGGANDN